jgi:hypothetical protein
LEEWALKCLDEAQGTTTKHVVDELELAANARTRNLDASSAASAILDRLNAQRGIVKGRLRIAREGNVTTVRINDVLSRRGSRVGAHQQGAARPPRGHEPSRTLGFQERTANV